MQLSDTLVVSLVTVSGTVLAPLFMLWLTGRQRAEETEVANNRIDEVDRRARERAEAAENKVAEAARLLLDNQKEVADKTDEAARLLLASQAEVAAKAEEAATAARGVADKAAETARLLLANQEDVAKKADETTRLQQIIINKTDVIHTLVNSNLTLAKQTELASIERELVLLKELALLHKKDGEENGTASREAIAIAEKRCAELKLELADRAQQDAAVKLQREAQIKDAGGTTVPP